jgi:hypothetical protein
VIGAACGFFTDEDIHGDVAALLRAAGFDAVSTPEAGRMGRDDVDQLTWAAQEGRVLVTFNVGDFARIHHMWLRNGRNHAGLVVSRQRSIGDLVRRLVRLGRALGGDDMRDRLEYLSNWTP